MLQAALRQPCAAAPARRWRTGSAAWGRRRRRGSGALSGEESCACGRLRARCGVRRLCTGPWRAYEPRLLPVVSPLSAVAAVLPWCVRSPVARSSLRARGGCGARTQHSALRWRGPRNCGKRSNSARHGTTGRQDAARHERMPTAGLPAATEREVTVCHQRTDAENLFSNQEIAWMKLRARRSKRAWSQKDDFHRAMAFARSPSLIL